MLTHSSLKKRCWAAQKGFQTSVVLPVAAGSRGVGRLADSCGSVGGVEWVWSNCLWLSLEQASTALQVPPPPPTTTQLPGFLRQ